MIVIKSRYALNIIGKIISTMSTQRTTNNNCSYFTLYVSGGLKEIKIIKSNTQKKHPLYLLNFIYQKKHELPQK